MAVHYSRRITIFLEHTTAPLLDMILAYAANRLFKVYVNDPDFNRLETR